MNCEFSLLKSKVALVTGTSRGIGRAIAETFAANDATVYANAVRENSLDDLVQNANMAGKQIIPLYFDVTDYAAAKAAIMLVRKESGQLDVLVNNAGIMEDELIGMVSYESIMKTFKVNVFAAMEMLQLAARVMMKQQSGSIINLASIVGINGNKGQLVYSASKGAVISMTKTAAKELAPYNIRVNAIAPGMIDTDLFRSISEEHQLEKIEKITMGRIGTTGDIAKSCLFLASELSNYVTGQIISVDGAAVI